MSRRGTHAREQTPRLSRRGFLSGLGVGAVGAAGVTTVGGGTALGVPRDVGVLQADPTRFGRIFSSLPPFAPTDQPVIIERVITALRDMGHFGGTLDAKDPIGRPPAELITDPAASVNNPDNPMHTAGTTFVGQFLDHDITFDLTSQLGVPLEPESAPNTRTPGLDLDSIYGGGPNANPVLYDSADRAKLRVESGGLFEDLPRASDGMAIIGDPRNDENLMVAGIHAAVLLFHNNVVDMVRSQNPGASVETVFAEARRIVTWHYQWMILWEFLPQIIGRNRVERILSSGRRYYTPPAGEAFIPVEFQGAAYRFGHSMVRPSYRANLAGDNGEAFFGMVFDPNAEGLADPFDLRGGFRAPRRFIGWQTFFDFGDGEVRPNKRIDTRISTHMFRLPLPAIPSMDQPIALPQRNLLRHVTWEIPSGQAIAQTIGAPVLPAADFAEIQGYGVGLERSTPLWFYVLKEAELMEDGLRLGPVGATIVGEVIIGLIQLAPGGFLGVDPSWQPTLPSRTPGDFGMVDLLTFAGVDPASRGQ